MGYGQRPGNGTKASMAPGLAELSSGPSRDLKRKLSPQGDINATSGKCSPAPSERGYKSSL